MSLIAVACGRGSRGVTTTALALTATWPAPAIVAECDPAGGSLAARFGMEPVTGMLSLASTARHGLTAEEVGAHVRRLPIGLPSLIGPTKAEQAEGIVRFWPTVAPVLARLGADVIADCGRLTARPPTFELLRHADLCLLVAEPTLDGLEQAKDRAIALGGVLREPPLLVLLGQGPYKPAEVAGWLAESRVGAELLGTLATDDRAATLLGGAAGRPKALARSTLLRSARVLAELVHARLATTAPRSGDEPAAAPARGGYAAGGPDDQAPEREGEAPAAADGAPGDRRGGERTRRPQEPSKPPSQAPPEVPQRLPRSLPPQPAPRTQVPGQPSRQPSGPWPGRSGRGEPMGEPRPQSRPTTYLPPPEGPAPRQASPGQRPTAPLDPRALERAGWVNPVDAGSRAGTADTKGRR